MKMIGVILNHTIKIYIHIYIYIYILYLKVKTIVYKFYVIKFTAITVYTLQYQFSVEMHPCIYGYMSQHTKD